MHNKLLHKLLAITLTVFALIGHVTQVQAEEDYLQPEQAFRFSARMADANTIEVNYQVADGYYLYRERFSFSADGAQLGTPVIPSGKIKFDATFNKEVETFRHQVTIRIPVQANAAFTFKAVSQGCADRGLCYSPMESVARVSIAGSSAETITPTITPTAQAAPVDSEMAGLVEPR